MSEKSQALDVKGMHCKSCSEKIESRLSKMSGVKKTRVDLIEEKVYVTFDSKTSIDKIKAEIEDAGYSILDSTDKTKKSSIKQGIIYGLIPHIGCIAFIIGSVLGVTVLTQFFRPLLLNPYFFYYLIALSVGFATISSAFYLRKNGFMSRAGVMKKWKYLSTMYGSTVGINLLLFFMIFPLLANASFAPHAVNALALAGGALPFSSLKLQVDIPCPGHATLISGDISALIGVDGVEFSLPNIFTVTFDSSKVSEKQILALEVFKTYKATLLSESSIQVKSASIGAVQSASSLSSEVQTIQLSVQGANYYPNPIRVKVGVPVRLVADVNNMPGCSKSIVIPEFQIRKYVSVQDNIIEFTPTKSGTFQFSCSMNMYGGQIIVENSDGSVSSYTGKAIAAGTGTCGGTSGGCGCGGR
jgi:copper ion binding protein